MSGDSVRTNKDIIEQVEKVLQTAYNEEEEFNATIDDTGDVKIPSLITGHDDYGFKPSEVLFWADRDAYNDELDSWSKGHAVEQHIEAIEAIKRTDQTAVLHALVEVIRRKRVAPFVGAGLSHIKLDPSKAEYAYPLWSESLLIMAERIAGVDRGEVELLVADHKYLEAAQWLWDADDTQVRNFVRTQFHGSKITGSQIKGPVCLLPKISHGCIITTNFDPVIEMVFGKGVFDAYMHGGQKENKFVPRLINGDRCILKLHGDAEDDASFVFTRDQYLERYGEPIDYSKPLPRVLRQIFISQSLLFLGCGLDEDRTLELFSQICAQGEFEIPDHFAILEEPLNAEERRVKEARLLRLKIRPLWFAPDKFEMIEQYLALALDMSDYRVTSI